MRVYLLIFFCLIGVSRAFAQMSLGDQYYERDTATQIKNQRIIDQFDRDRAKMLRQIERAARSTWTRDGDNLDCTYDGRVPQICFYKMDNGLICKAYIKDVRYLLKVSCK